MAEVHSFLVMIAATNPAREREPVNAWDKFLELVKSRVSINTYTTWFQPTRLNRAEGETLYVQIPNTVFRQALTRTYREIVKAGFHQTCTPNAKDLHLSDQFAALRPHDHFPRPFPHRGRLAGRRYSIHRG